MAKHSIQLTTGPLETLLSKKEVVDIRLDEPMWSGLNVGDMIVFVEDPSEERKVTVKILELLKYPSFEKLYEDNQKYFDESKEELLRHLYVWWTKEEEKKQGVLGIKVRVVNS